MFADTVQTQGISDGGVRRPSVNSPSVSSPLLRMRTNTAEIDSTITHPGSVKINVQGAFIVDQDSGSPNGAGGGVNGNRGSHDTKDIRLPNHTAVVSHIAVDVCISLLDVQTQELTVMADWRIISKAGLLFTRALLSRAGRQIELHKLRDGPDR
jgi:hypothetical protein